MQHVTCFLHVSWRHVIWFLHAAIGTSPDFCNPLAARHCSLHVSLRHVTFFLHVICFSSPSFLKLPVETIFFSFRTVLYTNWILIVPKMTSYPKSEMCAWVWKTRLPVYESGRTGSSELGRKYSICWGPFLVFFFTIHSAGNMTDRSWSITQEYNMASRTLLFEECLIVYCDQETLILFVWPQNSMYNTVVCSLKRHFSTYSS